MHGKLQGSAYEALSTEMRLRIAAVDAVFYPDVLVHCQHISNPATTMEFRPTRNGLLWRRGRTAVSRASKVWA